VAAETFVGESGDTWTYDTADRIGDASGMGEVFRGSNSSGEHVAVKRVTLRIDTERERRRREREVEVAERLEAVGADHVVPVLDIGRVGDVLLIVMPLAKRSLAAALRTGDLDDPAGTDAIRQVALGLQELAEASILHRDLKPANVLELDGRWQLADFGIARDLLESTGTYTFLGAGTLPYMAPELWREGGSTAKTDLYALGVTAYEVLVGNRPFPGPTEDDYRAQHLNDAPAAPKGLPDGMARLVLRLLAKDPTARPQNARAVVEAIDAAERRLTPAQDALRSAALDAERRRGETEAARARLSAATNQWESDRSQAIEDLREIVLQAHELAKDVLPETRVTHDGLQWHLIMDASRLTVMQWPRVRPAEVQGGDRLVMAGAIYSSALPLWQSAPAAAANIVCEHHADRLEWNRLLFRASGFSGPNYRLGPTDRTHGFDEYNFGQQREYMVRRMANIWYVETHPLTAELLLEMFVEVVRST
jgi:serine/threonine protein kinase